MSELEVGVAVKKDWGTEKWLVNGERFCCKRLIVKPGYRCSMHRHLKKEEVFIVESGWGNVLVDEDPYELDPGVIVEIPVGAWHMFWNPGTEPLVMLEISTHHDDADVERHSKSGPLKTALRVPQDFLDHTP